MRFKNLIMASLLGILVITLVSCQRYYKVQFYVDGIIFSEQAVRIGASPKDPGEPINNSYVFIRWDKDLSNIKSDTKVYAIIEYVDLISKLDEIKAYLIENFSNFLKEGKLPLTLEEIHNGSMIWYSNSLALTVDDDGNIMRNGQDDDVIITVLIKYYSHVDFHEFFVTIK